MKIKDIKAGGKSWNPQSVLTQPEDAFIADRAHAIEGLSKEESDTQLKGVYAKCKEAVEGTKPTAPAKPPKEGKEK